MKHLIIVFLTIFIAELGDKTQLATVLFAAERQVHPILIFIAASAALVAAAALGVVVGTAAERYLSMVPLKLVAGLGFVTIGAWTIWGTSQKFPNLGPSCQFPQMRELVAARCDPGGWDLSVRWCRVRRRIVRPMALSAFGLTAGRKPCAWI